MIASATSFAVTPGPSSPSTLTFRTFGLANAIVPVARTWATCDVPMPNAIVPKAPWVLVCESPQTIVMPGCVRPRSGPTTWTMPWSPVSGVSSVTPKSRQFRLDGLHHLLGQAVLQRAELAVGRDDVVDGGDGAVRVGDAQAAFPQHGEGLRAGDLVRRGAGR